MQRSVVFSGIIAIAVTLSACSATSQGTIRNMEAYGEARMERSTLAGTDYVVTVRNVIGMGYDLRDAKTRRDVAVTMASAQCPTASFEKEDAITTGNFTTGKPAITYSIYLKC